MSSSTNIDNRKKDILVLVKGLSQKLEHIECRKTVFI